MSFTSDSWKKTGGINRTSRHNLVRIPKAIEGSLKIYENTNSSNITIDGNSCLRIDQGLDITGGYGTQFGTYRIGEDVSSNIYDPRELIFMNTDPIIKNDYAYFMSESADGNTDRGNLTLVVADNSDAHDDKFIIRGYDLGDQVNTDIAYFSSKNGAVFTKTNIYPLPGDTLALDVSGNIHANGNIVMTGNSGVNYLQFPDATKQYTAALPVSNGYAKINYASITIVPSSSNQITLTEKLMIPSAGNWHITGSYKLVSAAAAPSIIVGGSSFLISDGIFGYESNSKQLHETNNSTNNSWSYTHTITNVVEFPTSLTYPYKLFAQVSLMNTNSTLYGEGEMFAIQVN